MNKSSQITRYAVISAIVFLGFAIDTLLRNVFAFQIAVVSLIAVLTVAVLCPLKEGLMAGLALGVFSMLRAFIMPSIGTALTMESFWISFTNPLIAVVPRVLIGFTVNLTYRGLRASIKRFTPSCAVASAVGVCTNTLCVCLIMLAMKLIFAPGFALWDFIVTYFTINCILELIVCTVVVPLLCSGLVRTTQFKGDN